MRYRIEFSNGERCSIANSRKDLFKRLKLLKGETITDIRKIYKSGVTDSVFDTYKNCLYK